MLHIWLIPALAVLTVLLWVLYFVVRASGGPGTRTEGRTLHDEPGREEDLPPGS